MVKPEKISPNGVREIGSGPKVYKIPMAKQSIPNIKTSKSVRITRIRPKAVEMASMRKIKYLTCFGFKL